MTGEPAGVSFCPVCGGTLRPGVADIPFALPDAIVVVKAVPADVCSSCREPYMAGAVARRVSDLVRQVSSCGAEVSVVTYPGASAREPAPRSEAAVAA